MIAAFRATGNERNTDINSRNDRTTTPPMNRGSREAVCSLSSMNEAVVPPTDAVAPVPSTVAGSTSSRRVWTRSSVSSSCGPVVGITEITAASPASFTTGGTTAATPGVFTRSAAMASGAAGRRIGQVDGDEQRPVGSRAVALGHEVVGTLAGQVVGAVAGVGHAEPQADGWRGQQEQHDQGGQAGRQRATLHHPAPAPRQRAPALDVVAEPRHPQSVDVAPGEAQQGGKHGDRREHHGGDGQRGGEGDAPQVAASHQQEAEDRDHDRRPGEYHRTARRRRPPARPPGGVRGPRPGRCGSG